MTWPFENDTSAITKKLAKRNLKADKSRNILIIITIALATCLIMTTTLYFFASQRKSLKEFGCNRNTYNPYQESDTPQFRNQKANWF